MAPFKIHRGGGRGMGGLLIIVLNFCLSSLLALLFALSFLPFSEVFGKELFVFCAAGSKELVEEVAKRFEKEKEVKVIMNVSSSGVLAKQIELGANGDVFISANEYWMKYLKDKGILKTYFPFAQTKLVLVARKGSSVSSFNEAEKIAVGDRLAPVGRYALETLKKIGVYDSVKQKLVFAPTVRHITVWVITGNADLGIIYYSDFLKFKDKLKLVKIFGEDTHSPILFFVSGITDKAESKEFVRMLMELDTKTLLKYGFFKLLH